jgi:hypothetical protein
LQDRRRFSRLGNPLDLGALGGMVRVGDAPSVIGTDPGIGLVMAFVHSLGPRPRGIVTNALAAGRASSQKPFVIVAPGGLASDEHAAYQDADIAVIPDTDAAFQAIAAVLSLPRRQPTLPEAAPLQTPLLHLDRPLTEPESLGLLSESGIAVIRTDLAHSLDQALVAAAAIGFPVVLKGVVSGIVHKTEAGLVKIGIQDADALRSAYAAMGSPALVAVQSMAQGRAEAIAGVTRTSLGLMLVAGLGGIYAEALGEVVMWPIPSAPEDIAIRLAASALGRMISSPRWPWPQTMNDLVKILLHLQDFALGAGDRLEAVDINPLLLSAGGPLALDAVVIPRITLPGERPPPA